MDPLSLNSKKSNHLVGFESVVLQSKAPAASNGPMKCCLMVISLLSCCVHELASVAGNLNNMWEGWELGHRFTFSVLITRLDGFNGFNGGWGGRRGAGYSWSSHANVKCSPPAKRASQVRPDEIYMSTGNAAKVRGVPCINTERISVNKE